MSQILIESEERIIASFEAEFCPDYVVFNDEVYGLDRTDSNGRSIYRFAGSSIKVQMEILEP